MKMTSADDISNSTPANQSKPNKKIRVEIIFVEGFQPTGELSFYLHANPCISSPEEMTIKGSLRGRSRWIAGVFT